MLQTTRENSNGIFKTIQSPVNEVDTEYLTSVFLAIIGQECFDMRDYNLTR